MFFLYPLCVFLIVVTLVPVFKKLAPALGLVDHPGGRKAHEGAVPLIGGLVVFPVFVAASLMAGEGLAAHWPLYAAIAVLLVTGAIDDRVHLHPLTKFAMQFLAAFLLVVPGGAELHQLGNLFGLGDFGLGFASLPFSIIAVVLLINAINLMDGLDGLAGGTALLILGWMLYACASAGEMLYAPSLTILMAALAGFLAYNMRGPLRRKASIFMGDAGSMSLGLLIAWYAIRLSPEEGRVLEPISVAWILAVPIWDECAQFYRRTREGRHPFSPDRGHLHHHFIRAGLSDGKAVTCLLALVFVTGAIGVLGVRADIPLPALTLSWIGLLFAHIAFSRDLKKYPRLIGKVMQAGKAC